MRKWLLPLLLLLIAPAVMAQNNTTVTVNVTDAGGQTWNNGTYLFTFVGPGTASWPGGAIPQTFSGSLNGSGSVSGLSIPNNNSIQPQPTFWTLKVCPNPVVSAGPSGCSFLNSQSITGASQTINVTPPAISISVPTVNTGGLTPITAYADAEISGGFVGFTYYNVTLGSARVCSALPCASNWSNAGGVTPPATANGPGQFNIRNYGAVGDAKSSNLCTTSNGTGTITNATDAPWVAGDFGKKIFTINGSTGVFSLSAIGTISAVNSASNISITGATGNSSAGSSQKCVWFTQIDTAAFTSAYTAAHASSLGPGQNTPTTGGYPSQVVCPAGGYVVDAPIINQQEPLNPSFGVSFIGIGNACVIYIAPTFNVTKTSQTCNNTVGLIYYCQLVNVELANFYVEGNNFLFPAFGTGGLIKVQNVPFVNIHGVSVFDWAAPNTTSACFYLQSVGGVVENNICQDAPTPDQSSALLLSNVSSIIFKQNLWSNHFVAKTVSGSGARNTVGGSVLFLNDFDDECSQPTPCTSIVNSTVNMEGGVILSTLSVDGTSNVYLANNNLGAFGAAAVNQAAITIASGGNVIATNNTIRGNGTTAAVTGPVGATFVSVGGNNWQNCVTGTCSAVTVANYGTQAFSGGIIPKSTETHSPNTCYAATGTLVATQNLCNILLDQNYQVLTISALSGGNAPASSSCTVAPVVTLSDGTRTATLTLTTGKTSWVSNVDASTVNSVFANGATLTVSIGTFTCATPPTNLSVSYALQSVLNF